MALYGPCSGSTVEGRGAENIELKRDTLGFKLGLLLACTLILLSRMLGPNLGLQGQKVLIPPLGKFSIDDASRMIKSMLSKPKPESIPHYSHLGGRVFDDPR